MRASSFFVVSFGLRRSYIFCIVGFTTIKKGCFHMAKSRAKKIRDKRMREGKMNPIRSRGTYALADLRTRQTKTKQEIMFQDKYGELPKVDRNNTDGGSFFCFAGSFLWVWNGMLIPWQFPCLPHIDRSIPCKLVV